MKLTVLTLFPQIFLGWRESGVIGKALSNKVIDLSCVDIRSFSKDTHYHMDAPPFGGGPGMVMQVEPLVEALEFVKEKRGEGRVILMSPKGTVWTQEKAHILKEKWQHLFKHLILICGRYEGIDERLAYWIDEEISVGDYIVCGGELPAMMLMESVMRLVPSVLGNEDSFKQESFTEGLLEAPVYTKPRNFRGHCVPEILLTGHHRRIEEWREEKAKTLTEKRRPDLWSKWLKNNQK